VQWLRIIHVAAGGAALVAAVVAAGTKALGLPHGWHVLGGRLFVAAMAGIFATAAPLAAVDRNPFLLLIAILSFYLAVAGWRYATWRSGRLRLVDWGSALLMVVASLIMVSLGVTVLAGSRSGNGVVMLVLGAIGLFLSAGDLRRLFGSPMAPAERIARHLTMMLAGTIAILTAFLVVNVRTDPAFIAWLAPTALLSPVIAVLAWRVRHGRLPEGVQVE
jgi:hypothetical protein